MIKKTKNSDDIYKSTKKNNYNEFRPRTSCNSADSKRMFIDTI